MRIECGGREWLSLGPGEGCRCGRVRSRVPGMATVGLAQIARYRLLRIFRSAQLVSCTSLPITHSTWETRRSYWRSLRQNEHKKPLTTMRTPDHRTQFNQAWKSECVAVSQSRSASSVHENIRAQRLDSSPVPHPFPVIERRAAAPFRQVALQPNGHDGQIQIAVQA